MRYLVSILFIFYLLSTAYSQKNRTQITVLDDKGLPLVGSNIQVGESIKLSTDINGRVVVKAAPGAYILRITFVGYKTFSDSVKLPSSPLEIQLSPDNLEMNEVTITGNRFGSELEETSTGFQSISMKDASTLPFLLGEKDPVKIMQIQSGVLSGADGNNGYYVRGGGIDQNMIMLDNMELYNANHLLGFFSMFNSEAIDRVDYYKSGVPSMYGKRLSSLLNVSTKSVENEKFSGNVGLGVLAADITLESPVIKGKSGMMISARRSYVDLIGEAFFSERSEFRKRTDYQLFDLIAKYSHKINSRNILDVVVFSGSDDYFYRSNKALTNKIFWSTFNSGITFRHLGKRNTDYEYFITYGNYNQKFGADISSYRLRLNSSIKDMSTGIRFFTELNDKVLLSYGFESIVRVMQPNDVQLTVSSDEFTLNESQQIRSIESSVYIGADWSLTSKLDVNAGLRVSTFQMLGPYGEILGGDNFNEFDTIKYQNNEIIASYLNPEPRISINYKLNSRNSIKFSYDRNFQYIHLSPISSVSLPTDIWVPSSKKIKPQSAHQVTLGSASRISHNIFLTLAGYYKDMRNQIEYRNGVVIGYSLGNNFDDVFIFGDGESFGLESTAKFNWGQFEGFVSYTLSKTTKTFAEINRGMPFPAKYDRRHDLNLTGRYALKKWEFSALFKLSSGNALTLPAAKYVIDGNIISEYLERNSLRMPLYHRLDLSATYYPGIKKNSSLTFSVYNTYNRENPYYVYFDVEGNINDYALDVNLQQVALFPILPSIAYNYKF